MKRRNELVPANSNDSSFTISVPDGSGTFEKGIDGRGNPFEKRTYDNGDFIKQELLKSGELKVTAKRKIR